MVSTHFSSTGQVRDMGRLTQETRCADGAQTQNYTVFLHFVRPSPSLAYYVWIRYYMHIYIYKK